MEFYVGGFEGLLLLVFIFIWGFEGLLVFRVFFVEIFEFGKV